MEYYTCAFAQGDVCRAIGLSPGRDQDIGRRAVATLWGPVRSVCAARPGESARDRRKAAKRQAREIKRSAADHLRSDEDLKRAYGMGPIAAFMLWWAIGQIVEAVFAWLIEKILDDMATRD